MPPVARARLSLGLIAAAAMLGSHWVAYFLAAPDPHERAHLLQAAGHGYWPTAVTIALGAVVIGLISFVGSRLSSQAKGGRSQIFAHAMPRFLGLQVGGFLLLEIVERAASGHGIALSRIFVTILVVGVLVQAVAALLCSLLLVLIAKVVERITFRSVPQPTPAPLLPLVSLISVPRPVPATGAHTLRGPPLSA
jgi:hypothetical protein